MNTLAAKTVLAYRNALSLQDYAPSKVDNKNADKLIFAIAADIAQLGYALSSELITQLKKLSNSDISHFHKNTVKLLKEVIGADVRYAPLFRKFPDEIPDRSYLIAAVPKAVSSYFYILEFYLFVEWSAEDYNGDWFGRQFKGITLEEAIQRPELICDKPLKILNVATSKDVHEVFTNLVGAKGSISQDDKNFVKEMIVSYSTDLADHLPTEIPNKENLAYTLSCVYDRYGFSRDVIEMFLPFMKTATDILRVAAAFSGDDVSLTEHNNKFKLSNSQRKFLLKALDALNYDAATEDMLRFHALWLILAKYLHVNAYVEQYPMATKMVQAIRNAPGKIKTFNRTIESQLLLADLNKKTNLSKFLAILSSRPGDFARRLDHILRSTTRQVDVVNAFLKVADKAATPMLLNLAAHFGYRVTPANVRVFLPKGNTTNAIVTRGEDRALLPVDISIALSEGIASTLIKRFASKGNLGKVYVDPALSDILIPTSMRDASSSLKVAARGSKFKIADDAKVVRLFLYWEDQKIKINDDNYNGYGHSSRVDVDLSCMFLDEDFTNKGVVSYYKLRDGSVAHSGDFTSAPNGAAEFIDVDIDKLMKEQPNVRYIAVTINSFTGQRFNTFVAKAGYMIRDGKTGKTFEAKTVEQKYDITAATKFAIPMILDLKERKVIWMDIGFKDTNIWGTNIGSKGVDLTTMAQYAVEMYREKNNLFELFMLHAKGRAESVTTDFNPNEKYDTVFDLSSATQIDKIMAEYI